MFALALALTTAQAAQIDMMKCFYGKAYVLDDHISSATVVAEGVVNACHVQFDEWKYDTAQDLRPLNAVQFYKDMDRAVIGIATQAVLTVRSAQKAKK